MEMRGAGAMRHMEKNTSVKTIYLRIIYLALFAHSSLAIFFMVVSYPYLIIYNLISVLFYIGMLYGTYLEKFKLVVSAIHIEVSCFVCISSLFLGFDKGFFLYLVALSSLVYFCPFDHKRIPYIFALCEMIIVLGLFICYQEGIVFYPLDDYWIHTFLFLYNTSAGFAIILMGAYLSDVSAAVTNEKLRVENKNLTALTNFDQLTGAWSRAHLYDYLETCKHHDYFLVLGDIDDFKHVNDCYGHLCGDYVLKEVAKLMKTHLEQKSPLARWGGEEFIMLFDQCTKEEVHAQVEKVRKALENHVFVYAKDKVKLTMTFGIYEKQGDESINSVFSAVDELMYTGKQCGKNCIIQK